MITICFYYLKESGWEYGEKTFDSSNPAIRFCWSMQSNQKMMLDGWKTYSPELNEEFSRKVNMYKINHCKKGGSK